MAAKKWVVVLGDEAVEVVDAGNAEEAVELHARTLPTEDAEYMREYGRALPLERVRLSAAIPGWQLSAFESGEVPEDYEEAANWIKVSSDLDLWAPVI